MQRIRPKSKLRQRDKSTLAYDKPLNTANTDTEALRYMKMSGYQSCGGGRRIIRKRIGNN